MGLKEKLLVAQTTDEINALLAEGGKYALASPKTKRQWGRQADARMKVLTTPPPAQKKKKQKGVESQAA